MCWVVHEEVFYCFRSEEVDRSSQLRTRAMRERDEKNPVRIYRFTLLRVKFPDGYILQGNITEYMVISSHETLISN
jgi:UBX domain-containing protein 6